MPDKAEIYFGVSTQASSAKDAQDKNATNVNKVISKLKDLGVKKKSIQTTDYDMWPRYNNNGDKIIGYQVNTSLKVSDINISDVGSFLSKCVEAGINDVDNIRYFCSTYDKAYQNALTSAVSAAKEKAAALATAAGKELGEVCSITEGYQDTSMRYNSFDGGSMKAAATEESADMDMEVMAGEVSISAQVTVSYILK